jgi:hypothetical protein
MDDLLVDLEKAVADAPGDPVERLRAAVRAHVLFHTRHQAEGFVGNSEVRNLEPEARAVIVEKRNAEQRIFERIIRDGVRSGAFQVQHEKLAARAIVTLCTAVLSWFVPGAGQSANQIADSYADLCVAMVNGKGRR